MQSIKCKKWAWRICKHWLTSTSIYIGTNVSLHRYNPLGALDKWLCTVSDVQMEVLEGYITWLERHEIWQLKDQSLHAIPQPLIN
jgi:hypothetical protein